MKQQSKEMTAYMSVVDKNIEVFDDKRKSYGDFIKDVSTTTLIDIVTSKIKRSLKIHKSIKVVDEDIVETVTSICNYAGITLTTLFEFGDKDMYGVYEECRTMFEMKNHDYDGAWALYYNHTFLELINIKVSRIRHYLDGIDEDSTANLNVDMLVDNLIDIINYGILFIVKHKKLI